MNNPSVFRIGGIAAIACAVLYIVSLVFGIAGSPEISRLSYILSSVLFIISIGVLTMALLPRNRTLAILAFLLLGSMTLWSLFFDPDAMDTAIWPLAVLYGLGFLLYGWIQYAGSDRTPGILALVTGALSVLAGAGLLVGMSFDIFGLFNLALSIPYVIWLIVMGWGWLPSGARRSSVVSAR